jgi:L-fuconolactonase
VRVDAHQHFWPDPSLADYPWMTDELAAVRRPFQPDDLAPLLATSRIDRTVVVQARPSTEETETLLAMAAETPFIAGVVGWVELTDPGVGDAIDRLRALPGGDRLVGIRHQVQDEPDPDWLRRPDVRRGIAAVGAAGLAYDLLVFVRSLAAAVDTVRAYPNVRFVLDHLAKPQIRERSLGVWAAAIEPLGALPNVSAKVSGLVTEAEHATWTVDDLVEPVRHAFDLFGPNRLLFGSDWPVCLVAASYERVHDAAAEALDRAGLAPLELDRAFGANAVDVYRLAGA